MGDLQCGVLVKPDEDSFHGEVVHAVSPNRFDPVFILLYFPS